MLNPPLLSSDGPEVREAATLDVLFAAAEQRQREHEARSPLQPRFLLESARSMGRHLGMTDARVEASVRSLAFWQIFLPAALASDPSNFPEAHARLPRSFAYVREEAARMEAHPRAVVAAFHMSGAPLVGALLGAAWTSVHENPPYLLLSQRNMAWLRHESARWVAGYGGVIGTDPAGLRRLISGLKEGAITRLMILVDGPHPPSGRGTRALAGLSPTLGFRTTLLTRILSMGIPVLPLTHAWESNRLVLRWHPALDPAEGESEVGALIEGLLRDHPEQWLNWAAAALRT